MRKNFCMWSEITHSCKISKIFENHLSVFRFNRGKSEKMKFFGNVIFIDVSERVKLLLVTCKDSGAQCFSKQRLTKKTMMKQQDEKIEPQLPFAAK